MPPHLFAQLGRLCLPVLALFAISTARAEYFWIDVDASGASIQAGELLKPRTGRLEVQGARAFAADGKTVALEARAKGYHSVMIEGDLRFTATRAEGTQLSIFHARYGRHETRAVSDLELVPTSAEGNTFRLYWKGTPVAASQALVSTSAGWSRVLRPQEDGSVSFEPVFPALYVLEVAAKINGTVTLDGREYADVRHIATLSFRVGP